MLNALQLFLKSFYLTGPDRKAIEEFFRPEIIETFLLWEKIPSKRNSGGKYVKMGVCPLEESFPGRKNS
jgi:hypothetical protein